MRRKKIKVQFKSVIGSVSEDLEMEKYLARREVEA